ncbi:MAG: putative colanic acid biosynthesis acetyltransferase [Variovorax sp.]
MAMEKGKAKILDARESQSWKNGPSFSLGNRVQRALFIVVWAVAASWTPRQLAPWRRLLLRAFGASMAAGSDVRGSAKVWYPPNLVMGERAIIGPRVNCYNMALITLEARALVSQDAHLCGGTHNFDDAYFQLQAREIFIGADAWVCAEAFVGPGARVAEGTVVGARCAVFGQLKPWTVYSGNPGRVIRERKRFTPLP